MRYSIGIDIGGTKCALSVGSCTEETVRIIKREAFPTAGLDWRQVLAEFERRIHNAAGTIPDLEPANIGISCGGPLDSTRGIVLNPPNLPGWDGVPVVAYFRERFNIPVHLQNDANACAWAEYRYGAGRGTQNMVFMTFGTGLGAGIVIGGRLYTGANDNAGEIGHIRLAPEGPVGYRKEGSAEGFCSGAGIVRLAQIRAKEQGLETDIPDTKGIFAKVREGDRFFTAVFRESAEKLATILAYTIDILNPEVIVLGGVFMRNTDLFMPVIDPILEREALTPARQICRIVPAELGESVGDYAALAVANM